LNHVWTSAADASEEAVRTCVNRLRKRLDTKDDPPIIVNVYGVGYKVE